MHRPEPTYGPDSPGGSTSPGRSDLVEWHGDKGYLVCHYCKKLVQINKGWGFGSVHVCLSPCERNGRHLDLIERRRGPFWRRRTETFCQGCFKVIGYDEKTIRRYTK